MRLTTIPNITTEQWKAQAERFSSIVNNTNMLTFPKKGVTNLKAIIEMNVVQPLGKGFKGHVKYIQQFEKIVEVPDPENEGQTVPISTTESHKVVDYYEIITRETVNVMIAQFTPLVPSDITDYLDIQDWIIQQAFINQVVSKETFGGLTAADYILTI